MSEVTPVPLHKLVINPEPTREQVLDNIGKTNLLNPLVAPTTTITQKDIKDLADQNINFVTPDKTWNQQKAENQGNLEQLYNVAKQVVVGHGIGGLFTGAGYIESLAQSSNIANNYDNAYSNSMTEIGNAILKSSQSNNPIWEEKQGDFNPGDWGYYMGRLADAGSVLSMVIPTGLIIKGLGYAAKGLTLASRFSKAANSVGLGAKYANLAVKGISSAIVSRQIESSMEADGIYQEQYNKYKELGYTELEAKSTASKAAASTYRGNWAMLTQDIFQYTLLGSKWSPASTKIADKGLKGFGKSLVALGTDALSEGAEEGYQYILGQESKAQSDIDSGLANADFGRSYRLKKDVQDGEFLNSVISGMFGSTVIQGGNAIAAKFLNKEDSVKEEEFNTEKIINAQTYADKYKDINQSIKQADLAEDKESAKEFRRELSTELALQSSDLGNIDKHTEFLEGLNAMSPEQMDAFNAENSTEYNQEFKELLPTLIEDSKKIGDLYNEGFRKFGDKGLANTYAKSKFDLSTKDFSRRTLDGDIARLSIDIPLLSDLSPAGVIEATAVNTINSNKALLKTLKKARESGNITGKRLEALNDNIAKSEESITKAKKDIQDSKLVETTEEQKRSDRSVIDSFDKNNQELNTKLIRRASLDMDLKVAIDTINKLNNNPEKIQENKINNSIDKANTVSELETIASTLPIDAYESTKEAYRIKLKSKYSELKQQEDNIKREAVEKEISFVQPTSPSIETPDQVEANNFKNDPDSEFNDLLIKQGKVINPLDLVNNDTVSVEDPHEHGAIVFGQFNNGVVTPDFIFWKADQVYFKKIDGVWTFEGDPIEDANYIEAIESSLYDIQEDYNNNNFYNTQVFTAKQREEILQVVNPSQAVITKENNVNTVIITEDTKESEDIESKKADIERRRQEELLSFLPSGLKSLFNKTIKIIFDKTLRNIAAYRKITKNGISSEDIALSSDGNYRNLLHELIHKFIDGRFDTDTRLKFRSRAISILNRISELSEGDSTVGRMLRGYTGIGNSIEEEVVTWYLTDSDFRNEINSLDLNVKNKVLSLIKEISGFTDDQLQEFINFDSSEKAKELAFENIDNINAKYDAELAALKSKKESTNIIIEIEEFTIEESEEANYLKPNLPGSRLAYKSYRGDNPTTDLREGYKKDFTDLIETPIPFSEKFEKSINLSIDLDYMKSNPSLAKLIPQLDTLEDIGNIPIKAELTGKNGKTYISYLYTSNTLRNQTYNTQEQIDNLLSLKRSVVEAYKQGTSVITKIDYTTSVLGGVFAKQLDTFENVPTSFQLPIEEFDLRVSSDNYYIKADGTEDFDLPSPKKKGNIYSVHKNTNGKSVPVKLWNSKITPEISNLILNIYKEINSKGRKAALSSEFKSSNSDILKNLINILDNPTYGTLLENLVYEGKNETATAKYPLYLSESKLTFGNLTQDINNIDAEAFLNYTTTNKYFQVNRKLLADNKYKKFLFDNILKTNTAAVDGNLFIQPTIVLSTDTTQRVFIPVKTEAISVPDESQPTTIVREDLEAPSIFDSKDIAPTKATVINEQEAIAWLRSNLSMVPVELQNDAIEIFKDGTQSIGRFTEGMIILSRLASTGTEYHEAFHAVSQLYLTEKERTGLYNKVKVAEGKQLTDRQAEELLADEFAYYVKSDGKADYKYVDKSPSSFFGKLLQWIKSVFSNTTTVDKVFKNINSGFYTNKVLPQNLKVTSYDKRVDNLSVEQAKNITDHLLYLAFVTQNLGSEDISKLDFNKATFELFKVYNVADSSFKERYERVFDSLCRSDWRTIFNNPKIDLKQVEWIDNYSPLATNLYEGLQTLGIKTKISKKTIEELDTELEDQRLDETDGDNYTPLTTKASYNYSNKETSRNNTKLLVASLPAIKEIKDGKNIYEKDDYFGLVKIADYGSTWSFLEDLLSNINPTNEQDGLDIMMNRIKDSLVFRPELSKLYNNLSSADDTVRTQFYTDMNLVKNNFATTLLTKAYNAETKKYNYEYKFQKGNQKNVANRITSEWSDLFNNNFLTDSGIDVIKVKSITDKISIIENKLKERSLSDSELNVIIENIYKTLNDLGFRFTSVNSLSYVINSIKSDNLQGRVSAFLLSKSVGIDKVIERISLGEDPAIVLPDEKGMTYVVNLEAKFRKDGFESSIVGAGGNKQWSYSYGSFFNKVISSMNNINESDFIKNLSNTPYFKNSVWFHQLKTNQVSASSITSSIFSSLKEENNGDSGSSLTDLAPNEEKSDIINRIIANIDTPDRSSYSTGLAKADKSTDVLIAGFKLIPAKYTNNQLSNAGIDILSGYLIDELNRTIQAHKDVDTWKENNNTSDLVEYYHYDPKSKDKFDKSGGAFRVFLFPELSSKLLKESNKDLYDAIYDESGVPYPISDNFVKNTLIRDYINTSFRKVLNFEIAEALKVGVVKQGLELENISLDNKLVSKRKETMTEQEAVISLFADYTLNGVINNVETTKFFHGDPAFYKGTAIDPFADIKKRTPLILATGRAQRVYRDKENNWVVPPTYRSAVLEDSEIASYYYTPEYIDNLADIYSELNGTSKESELSKLTEQFSAYKKVNETDAQAYITLDRYRITQLGWGKWSTAKQETFDAIKTWETNPTTENLNLARKLSKESDLAMQPLKSVHTGMEFHSSNPGIGIVEYNKQSEAVLNPVFTVGTPLDKLRKSMEGSVDHVIFRSGKKVGTQGATSISTDGDINSNIKFNKIKNLSSYNYYLQQDLPYHGFDESLEGSQIFNVVQSDVDFTHTYSNGMTGKELIATLQSTQAKLHDIGGQKLKDKYEFTDNWTPDNYKKLRKDIMEDLTKRGASDNIRETLQDTSFPFSAIAQATKRVTNAFNSMVNSSGVKLKMPGGPLIQISGFGIARPTGYTELNKKVKEGILWFGEKELSPPKLVKTEEGITSLKGQILVPHTIVESIEGWETMSKSELLSKIDKDTLYAIGYRIPNQGLSSNDSLEIVGILPVEAGDSVVLYNEVTTKTGADFDIDKMYIMVPNYNYNKESGRIEKVKYDSTNETEEGLQNYKLDLYNTLLSDPKSYLSVVAPLDSPFLSDTIDQLHGVDKVENRDLIFMSPGQQYNIKTSFRGGKTGIGILANNIVDHVQGQIWDLKLNGVDLGRGNRSIEGETVFSGLDCEATQDGTVYKISSVLSWFANAFVDIAKDPYITKGNFNDTTLSTTMMLVRAGFAPDWIINFMGQPILKDYVTLTNANKGRIRSYNDVLAIVKAKYKGESNKVSASIAISKLKSCIQNKDSVSNFNDIQTGILDLFVEFDRSAKVLQEQIRASKQNTNGAGKSNVEAFTISEQVNKVNSENKIGNFSNKFNGALGAAYENSVTLLRNMFGDFLFSDNSVNKQAIREISSDQGKLFATDLELNEKVSESFYSYVSSGLEFFKNTDLKELLYGKESIANRIYNLKYGKESTVRNNILIQYLEIQKQKGSIPGTVGINQFRDKSIAVQNQITQSWEELLSSDNPKTKAVAEDLVKYAFYSSGFNPTSKSFFEYIPYKYLKQIGFGDYMDNFMKNPNNQIVDSFKEQFYQNNIDSDYIKDFNKNDIINKNGIVTIKEDSLKKFFIGYSTVNNTTQIEYSRYIKSVEIVENVITKGNEKIKIFNKTSKLYKLQGYDISNVPMYTQIGIKGYSAKDGNRVVEYSYNENKESIFNLLVKDIQIEVSLYPQTPNSESYNNTSENKLTKVNNTNFTLGKAIIDYINSILPNFIKNKNDEFNFVSELKALQLLSFEENTKEELISGKKNAESALQEWADGNKNLNSQLNNILANILLGKLAEDGLSESDIWHNLFNTPLKNTNEKNVSKTKNLEFVFNENPILKEVGTKKQYSNYLDTIFPNSTLTDIVYHGTNNKNEILKEGFKNNSELFSADDDRHYEIGELGNGYYFTPSINSAKNYGEIVSAVINNPDVENKTTFNNITNEQETQYFVKSKKQIHVLGTEQDIEGFKEYVKKDVSLNESIDLENDLIC